MAEADQLGTDQMKQMILSNWGYSGWRNGQEEIVDHMLSKTGNCVISIPTGGGKSVLFQVRFEVSIKALNPDLEVLARIKSLADGKVEFFEDGEY